MSQSYAHPPLYQRAVQYNTITTPITGYLSLWLCRINIFMKLADYSIMPPNFVDKSSVLFPRNGAFVEVFLWFSVCSPGSQHRERVHQATAEITRTENGWRLSLNFECQQYGGWAVGNCDSMRDPLCPNLGPQLVWRDRQHSRTVLLLLVLGWGIHTGCGLCYKEQLL